MPKGLQLTSRILLYILRVALWVALAVALILFAYNFARDMSNIYIISTDGMQKRASVVLNKDNDVALEDFFAAAFIAKDTALNAGEYEDYYIRDFDYKLSIQWMWVLPWNDKGKVTVREQVPIIDGEMLSEKMPQGATEKILPPPWVGAIYDLTLTREAGGKWLISEIKKTDDVYQETPLPLLTLPPGVEFPTATPVPSATPTPKTTPSILGGPVIME